LEAIESVLEEVRKGNSKTIKDKLLNFLGAALNAGGSVASLLSFFERLLIKLR